MQKVTLTSKGQLTLPIYIRRHFGLAAGDQLLCTIEGGYIRMAVEGQNAEAMAANAETEPERVDPREEALHTHAIVNDDEDVTLL